MKIFISSDIEGTAGICAWDETDWNDPRSTYFRQQMTREVSAACRGAEEAGAADILVKDAHSSARNIDPRELPQKVRILRGWPGNMLCMMAGINTNRFDAALMTGYHSCAGSDGNPLSHTMNTQIDYMLINGTPCSEFMMNAYIAAYFGVPTCFLSGDRELCRFAEKFIPGITTVAVSEGTGNSSISIHPDLAVKLIHDGVVMALEGDYKTCMPEIPEIYKVEICYKKHQDAFKFSQFPGAALKGTKSITFENVDYLECLRLFHFVL